MSLESSTISATSPGASAVGGGVSFEAIYRENFDFVWRTARRMSVREGSVDDVVQDTFVVVHRRLADYDGRVSVRGWIYGILGRVVSEYRRRFRRKEGKLTADIVDEERGSERFPSAQPSPESRTEQAEAMALIERLLGELAEDHREVLVLSRLEQLSVPEIAECIGANVNTIYSRLRVAGERFDAAYARVRAEDERRLSR